MTEQKAPIGCPDNLSKEDFEQIRKWNEVLPKPVVKCVHHLFHENVREYPDAEAICSWDGSLSYAELDAHAIFFATRLVYHYGVRVDSMVPICFEKSKWAVVAMIAVLKAGAAFVPLPCSPRGRIEDITALIKPCVIITSNLQAANFEGLSESLVVVGPESAHDRGDQKVDAVDVKCFPGNLAYVLFTSGSTGVPKGVQIEHQQLCTHLRTWGDTVGMNRASRVFQFGSYVFDACIDEVFLPLIYGGTICIPSEDDRVNNIAGAMKDMHVTYALFMPSLLSTLRPEDLDLDTLQTLVVAGELSTFDLLDLWAGVKCLQLFNAYGPTETCVINCALNVSQYGPIVGNIGRPIGGCYWIVEETDMNRLCPIGTTGELIIEGPTIGRGYVGLNQQQTKEAFISAPSWLSFFPDRRQSRFYRTGDLATYNPDGTIQFAGRRDLQVKLRGQRMELGEVEYQLRRLLPPRSEVVVEIVHPEKRGREPMLVAFTSYINDQDHTSMARKNMANDEPITSEIDSPTTLLKEQLAKKLPTYMIPSAFLSLESMPRLESSKTNRARLREIAIHQLFAESDDIDVRHLNDSARTPLTDIEVRLQRVWADAFRLYPCRVGIHDNFFHLGGDSVIAIRLVAVARRSKLLFKVSTLLDKPSIARLATAVQLDNDISMEIPAPYLLINKDEDIVALRIEASFQCGITTDAIQDIYPLPKLYEAYMCIPKLIGGIVFPLPPNIDLDRYLKCWESLIESHDMLRTRIIQTTKGMFCVIEKPKPPIFRRASRLKSFLAEEQDQTTMTFGESLSQYCSIVSPTEQIEYFVWTAHHAIFDAWSLPIINSKLAFAYTSTASSIPAEFPKAQHIFQHLSSLDPEPAKQYWLSHYDGVNFKPLFPRPSRPWLASQHLPAHRTTVLPSKESAITAPTLIAVAWGLVLSRHTSVPDVPLGIMRSGRTLPIGGVSQYIGALATLYPWAVRIDEDVLVRDFVTRFQRDMWASTEYEYFGLVALQELCPQAAEAMKDLIYLNIHPEHDEDDVGIGGGRFSAAGGDTRNRELLPRPYEVMFYPKWQPLRLEIELRSSGFVTMIWYDESIERNVVEGLMTGFERAYGMLVDGASGLRLRDVG